MQFVNIDKLDTQYENYPFPHVVIDNFLKSDVVDVVLKNINNLQDNEANSVFTDPNSKYEYNKYAFSDNYGVYLKQLFIELNSDEFVKKLEKLTGIDDLIKGDIQLQGAGIHRIKNKGFLQLHTDFNTYINSNNIKLDRRINLLIYMNPNWKQEYHGELCLCDKVKGICTKKIQPILNRCVIFNTTNKSIHGHPKPLCVPDNITRQSIALYYYTKNNNGDVDFEGDRPHNTIWYKLAGLN
jgi:Rps23 Pro-64 3,4-dihydroxylase Tpa1-like proline 4-hydroxylase